MRCPACDEMGKPSSVKKGTTERIDGAVEIFSDEHEKNHEHDRGYFETTYECTMGHRFVARDGEPCKICGWKSKKLQTMRLPPADAQPMN